MTMLVRVCNRLIVTASEDGFKGAYVAWLISRKCGELVHRWCQSRGVVDPVDPDELHCTITYSPVVGLDDPSEHGDRALPRPYSGGYTENSPNRSVEMLGPDSGPPSALVCMLDSPIMAARHEYWRDARGLVHAHPSFIPHVTLSYASDAQDPAVLRSLRNEPLTLPLTFDRERVSYCKKPGDEE